MLYIAPEEVSTYVLGHHLRAIVYGLEYRCAGDLDAINFGERGIVLLDLDVGAEIEDLGDI